MGYGIIDTSTLTAIANAIREKLGVQTQYKPSEMPEAIESISGGGITPTGTKSITANGTYDVTQYASAEVAVPAGGGSFPTKVKDITITMDADYSQASYLSVNLEPLASCAILVVVDSIPSPPSSGYIAMWWSQGRTTSSTNDTKGIIMRTDGTYGTDINACAYNATTGILKVGGPYGTFPQGATYRIYQYSFES